MASGCDRNWLLRVETEEAQRLLVQTEGSRRFQSKTEGARRLTAGGSSSAAGRGVKYLIAAPGGQMRLHDLQV